MKCRAMELRIGILLTVLFAVVFAVMPASAAEGNKPTVLRFTGQNGDTITLGNQKACELENVKKLGIPLRMYAGSAVIEGKAHDMCWTVLPRGTVGIVYDDGDWGEIPIGVFKPVIET